MIEGWYNKAKATLGILPEEKRLLGESRLLICKECPIRTQAICDPRKKGKDKEGNIKSGCGCVLTAKVLEKNSKCPLGKW